MVTAGEDQTAIYFVKKGGRSSRRGCQNGSVDSQVPGFKKMLVFASLNRS